MYQFTAFICLILAVKFAYSQSVVIRTTNGQISGAEKATRLGRQHYAFLGIPYAQPPVGDLRFEPPQSAVNWTGIRDGSVFGNSCYQSGSGSEDCLYLNVYTPNVGPNGAGSPLLPVMFYVHGGAFQGGDPRGNTGDYLLDENVVLVNVNYRLHSLGFLNTGDGLVKGNMGLKDLAMALQWVRANIARFGGDPNRVTVFGQSAGGAAVSYILLSPLTKDLLHGAISQSGSATKIWSFQPKPKEQAQLLASRMNCPLSPPAEMVACLKKADVAELTRQSTLSGGAWKNDLEVFTPTIETVVEGAFISKHPYDIVKNGEAHRVPYITGVNTGEGLLYTYPIRDSECMSGRVNGNWSAVAPKLLFYNTSRTDITEKVTRFYLGSLSTINFRDQFANFTQMWTDRYYITFTRNLGEMQSKFSPVYFYYNDFQVNPGFVASHGEEMFLLFPGSPAVGTNSPHFNRSRDMVRLWTQFATGGSTLNFEGSTWDPIDVSSGQVKYLKFGNDFNGIVSDPIADRVRLWNEVDLYRVGPENAGPISYC